MRPPLRVLCACLLIVILICVACRQRNSTPVLSGGCWEAPLIGPVGHVELALSSVPDSALAGRRGRIAVSIRWSSDSLARESRPAPVRFRLTSARPQLDSAGYMRVVDTTGLVAEDSGIVQFMAVATGGSYELSVGAFGGGRVDTTLTIRPGFTDTARVFLQAGGVQMCA